MTGVTLISGIDVRRSLPSCRYAIMATLAGAPGLIVIHRGGRHPGGVDMTGLAQIRAIDVCGPLARGARAIMTTATGVAGQAVIEYFHQPVGGSVAGVTGQRGGNMIHPLARGADSIVATLATANRLRVIHGNQRNPCRVAMAGLAQVRGVDVGGVLAGGDYPVMTTGTGIGNT